MTLHDRRPSDLDPSGGAAPVADIAALSPERSAAILFLRDWCVDADGERRVRSVFEGTLGWRAEAALDAFDGLIRRLSTEGRRPMLRHAPGCRCVGSDEAVFANLLCVAATGDREDAMLVASLLAPGGILTLLVHDAQQAGLAILTISRHMQAARRPAPPTLLH